MQWMDSKSWACARQVAIVPFPVLGNFKGNHSIPEYMKIFSDELGRGLRNAGIDLVLASDDAPAGADVIIKGEFVDLTGGSRAARFWVGMGAGKAKCHVRVRAVRGADDAAVFSAEHERISAFGLSKDELTEDVTEVARDLAKALAINRGQCAGIPAGSSPTTIARAGIADSAATAAVTIESSPPNAEVSLDGKLIGTTPLMAYPMVAGTRSVAIAKKGHLTWRRNLAVVAGAATRLSAELEVGVDPPEAQTASVAPSPASLSPEVSAAPKAETLPADWERVDVDGPNILLVSEPPGAIAFIDGDRKGITSEEGLPLSLERSAVQCVLVHKRFGGKKLLFRVGTGTGQSRVVIKLPDEEPH